MANEKKPATATTPPPEAATATAPAKRYVGEPYDKGIVMPEGRLVQPHQFTPPEIEAFVKRYPNYTHFFA